MTEHQLIQTDRLDESVEYGLLGKSIGPGVRLLRNMLSSRVVIAFEPYGLRSGSFSTLALISANPGCSQSDIAKHIGTDKSIVVAIVDDLEQRGFAERKRSTQDRRRNALSLTSEGEALLTEMHKLGQAVEKPIRAKLSAQEISQLIKLTQRAVDAMMEDEEAARS